MSATLMSRDSLNRGSMSRAAHEDVASCVYVPVMGRSAAARPGALIQSRTTFRPGDHAAYVAGLGTPRLVHFLVLRPIRNRLVGEHCSEGRPARIADGLSHGGFLQRGSIDIAHRDVIELSDDPRRELMQKVAPAVRDARVDIRSLPLLVRSLRLAERFFKLVEVARVSDDFTRAQSRKVLQSKVDADTAHWIAHRRIGHLNADIQKPVSASVAGKIRPVFNLGSWRQGATFEYLVFVTVEVKTIWRFPDVGGSNRKPPEGFLPSVPQIRSLVLSARSFILSADGLDGVRVQSKFFAASGGELVQVISPGPLLAPPKRTFLSVVAKIPDERYRTRLFIQQANKAFNAVSVREKHRPILSRKDHE